MTEKEQNEQKKEYLNSYKRLCRKLQSLEEQLESLREVEQSAKIQEISDMPKGGIRQTDLSDYMVKLDKITYKIIRAKQDCMNRKLDIENRIADMEDGLESTILHKRYIELKAWEQIGKELEYSSRQIIRIHGQSLRNFEIPDLRGLKD